MISFALLLAAMAAFLASTIQTRLWVRGVLWLGGAGALGYVTCRVALQDEHRGFYRIIWDAIENISTPSQSVLYQSLVANQTAIVAHVRPLADILLVTATLTAFAALLAFTKGERLEKIIRPILYGLVGAMFGGAFALGVVGLGFGDLVKRRAYATSFSEKGSTDIVFDGDTFQVGEFSLRLHGADAPELEQTCIDQQYRLTRCGDEARHELRSLLKLTTYICRVKTNVRTGRAQDSFGRPLVECTTTSGVDLARKLITEGWATQYAPNQAEPNRTTDQLIGGDAVVIDGDRCTLQPRIWRRNPHKRQRMMNADSRENREWAVALLAQCFPPPNSDNPR